MTVLLIALILLVIGLLDSLWKADEFNTLEERLPYLKVAAGCAVALVALSLLTLIIFARG